MKSPLIVLATLALATAFAATSASAPPITEKETPKGRITGPPQRAFPGEILRVVVLPNPIVQPKPPQLAYFTIAVLGRGSCDHVVVYWLLSGDQPGANNWVAEKKNVVFSNNPAKTSTVVISKGDASVPGKFTAWALPGPGSQDCKGKAHTDVTVKKWQ